MSELKQPANTKIPLRKALLAILLSVVCVSGSCALTMLYFKHVSEKQRHDPAYQIVAIVQSSSNTEDLKTVYLAELLNLSIDRPTNLYSFSSKEARQRLLHSPVIKDASVKKIRPGTIYVDYMPRKPIAFIADYSNTAIDSEGVVFPFKPFFTPKKLPEIYLGGLDNANDSQALAWGNVLEGKRVDLAFNLLKLAARYCCDELTSLSRIDVSDAFAPSYGQRQIVLVFEEKIGKVIDGKPVFLNYTRILRLAPDNYSQQLANYLELRKYLRQNNGNGTAKTTIIDLRLSDLAFIEMEP